jgi:hypothetical protein
MLSKYIENNFNTDTNYVKGLSTSINRNCNYNYQLFFDFKSEDNSNLQDVLNLIPINYRCRALLIGNKFINLSNKRIYELFTCSDKLVGVNLKDIKFYIARGIITDTYLKTKLSVMIKASNARNNFYFKTEDIIVLVHKSIYNSKTVQNPVIKIIKNIVNDCIDNDLEVRIVDDIKCFAVPDVYNTEIGTKVNKNLLESITLNI